MTIEMRKVSKTSSCSMTLHTWLPLDNPRENRKQLPKLRSQRVCVCVMSLEFSCSKTTLQTVVFLYVWAQENHSHGFPTNNTYGDWGRCSVYFVWDRYLFWGVKSQWGGLHCFFVYYHDNTLPAPYRKLFPVTGRVELSRIVRAVQKHLSGVLIVPNAKLFYSDAGTF